jgi:hypothetical protein
MTDSAEELVPDVDGRDWSFILIELMVLIILLGSKGLRPTWAQPLAILATEKAFLNAGQNKLKNSRFDNDRFA